MSAVARALTPARVTAALVGAFALAALLVAVATPPFEGNDENHHVHDVERLAGGHWYRIDDPQSGLESHQAPLYYLGLAAYQRVLLGLPEAHPHPVALPPGGPRVFRHDLVEDGADQRLVTLLRLPGVLLVALAILAAWLATRRLSADPWTPVVAAALLCGTPRLTFLAGVVNNDDMAIATGSVLLALCVLALARPATDTRAAARAGALLGAALGAVVLSKLTAAALLPAVAAAIAYGTTGRRTRAVAFAAAGAAALAVCGWWLVQNQVRYGDPLASDATREHLRAVFPYIFSQGSFAHQAFSDTPSNVFRSFWYVSGWGQVHWHSAVPYAVLWLALAAGIAGLARRAVPLGTPRGTLPVLWLAVAGGFAAIWYLGVETRTTSSRVGYFALPALAMLYALGTQRLALRPAWRLALPVAGVALTYVAIVRDVLDYYPS